VLVVALLSPLDVYADLLLSVHMVQHLLLTMAAPPLLLLGSPLTLALRTVRPADRAVLLNLLRGRAVRALSSPVLGWMLFVGTLWVSHLPAFYDATIRHTLLHAAEHLAYVATALLFWRPVVGTDPSPVRLSHPARILSLFLFMPQATFLGLAIYSSDRPLYAPYIATSQLFGTSAVSDQHLAGAIMWAAGMFFMVPAMVLVLIDWMRSDEREAVRADARLERADAKRSA
jgi:putative membrane protein